MPNVHIIRYNSRDAECERCKGLPRFREAREHNQEECRAREGDRGGDEGLVWTAGCVRSMMEPRCSYRAGTCRLSVGCCTLRTSKPITTRKFQTHAHTWSDQERQYQSKKSVVKNRRMTHSVEQGQVAKVAEANKDGRQRRAEQDTVDRCLLPLVEVGE